MRLPMLRQQLVPCAQSQTWRGIIREIKKLACETKLFPEIRQFKERIDSVRQVKKRRKDENK
jgi:hypothetical protein